MLVRALIIVAIIAVGSIGLSCSSTQNYTVDKTSPNGVYRVKVDAQVKNEGDSFGHFTEQVKIQVLKGQEIIFSNEWSRRDNWESTFIDDNSVIEWVGDNVLRMGQDRSDQPFLDELIISNKTDEYLKYLRLDYGRFENFEVFDIGPGQQMILLASPRFKPDLTSNHSLAYLGQTQSGMRIEGSMEQDQRKSPDEGRLKFQIAINKRS